jgi:hypothetical protein
MTRRRDESSDEVMTRDELNRLRESLAQSGLEAVRHAYHTCYARCRMVNGRAPSARSIQELVQVWKRLWKSQLH